MKKIFKILLLSFLYQVIIINFALADTQLSGERIKPESINSLTKLYNSTTLILNTPLTNLNLSSGADISSSDSIISGFGKLQKQIDSLGSGSVNTVFGRTGDIIAVSGDYTSDLITEVTNKRFVTDSDLVKLSNLSGVNSGDQDLSGKADLNSPSLITPNIGAATATTVNKVTITAPASSATLTIANTKTLTVSNDATISGTNTGDQTNITGNAGTVTTNANLSGPITSVGNTTSVNSQTGTGSTFVMNTSPTIATPTITQPTVTLTTPTSDGTFTGPSTRSFNAGYSSTAIGDLVILDSSATWQKADANSVSLYSGLMGVAMEVSGSGNPVTVALSGAVVYATAFPTMTIGATLFVSETPAAITATAPTTTDSATRVIGFAIHADKILLQIDGAWITHI